MPALCQHNKPPIMPKAMPAYCACLYMAVYNIVDHISPVTKILW